jgi:putative hydrolase of the HAD superfamily
MINDDLVKFYKDGRTLIFDLDNTLFDERRYLFGAYKSIAKSQSQYDHAHIYKYLCDEFERCGRVSLLDKLQNTFPELDISLCEMLDLMRTYDGSYIKLDLNSWFVDFLSVVSSEFIIRIITNGNIKQQKNKVNLLNINNLGFSADIAYANLCGGKPNIGPYSMLVNSESFSRPVYIGDSNVDKIFCQNLGIDFYNIH